MKEQNEKQAIEEMVEISRHVCEGECFINEDGLIDCDVCRSLHFYDNGYRNQEWISVKERLPERMKPVLVCVKGYLKKPIMVVSEMLEENGARWSACAGFTVTHWMPLPEPPKMKGGE